MFRHAYAVAAAPVRRRLAINVRSLSSAAAEFDMSASFTHTEADGYVRHSAFDPISLPNLRIDQFVWQDVQRWETKTALVCGETDRQLTYAQLRDHCAAVAVRLQRPEFGLGERDVVALCLPNTPDYPIACLGVIEAGLTVTSVNPIYTAGMLKLQWNGILIMMSHILQTKSPSNSSPARQNFLSAPSMDT